MYGEVGPKIYGERISVKIRTSSLLKKTHMLRCAQSPRVNVLPMYASARRFSRASPLDLFEQPARGFFSNLLAGEKMEYWSTCSATV